MPETQEIRLEVTLDEKRLPTKIRWEASEGGGGECRAFLLSLWDSTARTALRLDLWTPEMTVVDMKVFCCQTLAMMAETIQSATREADLATEIRELAERIRRSMAAPDP